MRTVRSSESYMTRREFLKYGLYTGLAASLPPNLFLGGCGKKRSDIKSTNIILISIDTLRADHLGCYGYQRPTSPTLDKLAHQGLFFEDVSAPSPWTLPAHASLLTGLYPNRHALKSHRVSLPAHVVTLAEVLKEHGFLTAAIVNSHNLSKRYGLNRGFSDFTYVREKLDQVAPSGVQDEALKWLSKHSGEPFFLFLHYYDVHSDYCSLPRYEKGFVRPYRGVADGTTAQLLRFRRGKLSLTQADAEHLMDLYDASIRQMDDGIRRLLRFLETKELLNNTLVIVTSDHGEEFLEHGGVLHGRTQFQEVIRVPLLMRGPGLPQSKRVRHIISLVDVMPTVLALFDIPKPASLDGIDLRPLWQKSDAKPPLRFIFAEADHNNVKTDIKRAVRHPRYKLHYDILTRKKQLYDLRSDPGENIDVASEHGAMVDSLFRLLKNFMRIKNTGQPLPPLSSEEINKLKGLGYLQ